MLEGSFRPPSATAVHQYSHPLKAAYGDHPSHPPQMRRKDNAPATGPTFTPILDRIPSVHSPGADRDDRHFPGSPPAHHGRFFPHHHQRSPSTNSIPTQPQPNHVGHRLPPFADTPPPPPSAMSKAEQKSSLEASGKDPSFGPVRAKKKPAGSACNSCHRLKTRCSGGYPCDRCAAHKVPCQFDRDLIYRSPLASSSQQASARNAQVMHNGEPNTASKGRSRAGQGGSKPPSKRTAAAAAAAAAVAAAASATTLAPASAATSSAAATPPPPAAVLPPPPPPTAPTEPAAQVSRPLSSPPSAPPPVNPSPTVCPPPPALRKQPHPSNVVSTPAPPEAFVGHEPTQPVVQQGLHVRLAALENSVSGLLQVLRVQQAPTPGTLPPVPECSPPSRSPYTPPNVVLSNSCSHLGPERDRAGDALRVGCPGNSGIGDPLSEGVLSSIQVQYLYDVFVEYCLPNLPILHRVHLSAVRGRSPFLFSVMLAIGARFCSTQSVTRMSAAGGSSGLSVQGSATGGVNNPANAVDEQTYARLVALAYRHLSGTLLKGSHCLDDVRAVLFLACWALVSNEDPVGPPNRWVLIGHASRIARAIGLDRCAADFSASPAAWSDPDNHEGRREQLDAIKTDQITRSMETILSSSLRLEPSRDYFPGLGAGCRRGPPISLVKLATGSPFQYDLVSCAQVDAVTELAQLWAEASTFLSATDDRSRVLGAEHFVELGERHDQALDAWAKKWTWHGSPWVPLLGTTLRTVRLLSESLRITLNLALTNVLYAAAAAAGGFASSGKFHETLAISLERVNGSSTAVIQAHRDAAREGFSLAFAPDVITDGLVSAAITVLQLASPLGIGAYPCRPMAKDVGRLAVNSSRPSSIFGPHTDGDRPLTPASSDGRTSADNGDSASLNVSSSTSQNHRNGQDIKTRRTSSTAASSPTATPRGLSASCSPQERNAPSFAGHSNSSTTCENITKKPFMEPAVAAHYIRMATDVLQVSDRSQTRLATTMAGKIVKLATHAGLLNYTGAAGHLLDSAPVSTLANPVLDSAPNGRHGRSSASSDSSRISGKALKSRTRVVTRCERTDRGSPPYSHGVSSAGNSASSTSMVRSGPFHPMVTNEEDEEIDGEDDGVEGTVAEPHPGRTSGSYTFPTISAVSHQNRDVDLDEEEPDDDEEEDEEEDLGEDEDEDMAPGPGHELLNVGGPMFRTDPSGISENDQRRTNTQAAMEED